MLHRSWQSWSGYGKVSSNIFIFMSELLPPSSPGESPVWAQVEGELQHPHTSYAIISSHLLCLEPYELISHWDHQAGVLSVGECGKCDFYSAEAARGGCGLKAAGRGFQIVLPVWESVSLWPGTLLTLSTLPSSSCSSFSLIVLLWFISSAKEVTWPPLSVCPK